MKKNIYYVLLIVLFLGAAGFVVVRYRKGENEKAVTVYQLQQRKGAQGQSEEWSITKKAAEKLMAAVEADPNDKKALIQLANMMIIEARITGDYTYYDNAALHYINKVLAIEPTHFEATMQKALVQLSQHHFEDGLNTAEKARQINPYNAFIYGILVDANVEMGRYDSAVAAADKMLSIRPDLRSYARSSYLREIYGDNPGAVEAMQMAIEAGVPGDESTSWCRVQLGHLFENMGDMHNAYMQYNFAVNERPGYPWALAGLARIALVENNIPKAIGLYQQADSIVGNAGFKQEMAAAYKIAGDEATATMEMKKAIGEMTKNAAAALKDESLGHYSDKELAEIYINSGDYNQAVNHALSEYNRRPGNIDVNETLAWAYFHQGDMEKAATHVTTALKTGSRNPVLLCRAGLIYLKAGNHQLAKSFLDQGLQQQPNIAAGLKKDATNALLQLK